MNLTPNWWRTYRFRRWIRREAAAARHEPDTVRHYLQSPQFRMLHAVTVRDRLTGPWWQLGLTGPIRTVNIALTCPRCGGYRGVPVRRGRTHTWTNPCGHRDRPREVVTEADALLLGARVDAHVQRILAQSQEATR